MKVLFTSFPAFGHLLPMLPLADAAHAAGDDVLVSTNATFASVVGNLPFLSSGLSLPELMAENDRRTGVDLMADVADTVDAGVELFTRTRVELDFERALRVAADFAPDLLVAEMWDYLAPLVAAELDIPWVSFHHSPATLIDEPLAAGLQRAFKERRLTPRDRLAGVQLWPDWLQLRGYVAFGDELAIRPDPYDVDSRWTMSAFGDDRPTVLVTLGTVLDDRALLTAAVDAVLAADVNILVTSTPTASPESLAFDPARVQAVSFAPMGRLLDGVCAVVTVGGSGTTIAALSRGLPLVFLPQFANQPVIADAVSAVGAGVVSPGASGLTTAVTSVVRDPRFERAAKAAATRLADLPAPQSVWLILRDRSRDLPATEQHRLGQVEGPVISSPPTSRGIRGGGRRPPRRAVRAVRSRIRSGPARTPAASTPTGRSSHETPGSLILRMVRGQPARDRRRRPAPAQLPGPLPPATAATGPSRTASAAAGAPRPPRPPLWPGTGHRGG